MRRNEYDPFTYESTGMDPASDQMEDEVSDRTFKNRWDIRGGEISEEHPIIKAELASGGEGP